MKAIIVTPGLTKFLPYICLYQDLFKRNNVEYRILQWNRMNVPANDNQDVYSCGYAYSKSFFKRTISYFHYIKWVRNAIKVDKPDLIVIATIAPAVCLLPMLYRWKYKYILDIRDYSPLIRLCRGLVSLCIKWSKYTLISSKGFIKWLPNYTYLPVYNFGIQTLPTVKKHDRNNISIATIGFLRDFNENALIIDAFGNKKGVDLFFHGNGLVLNELTTYAKDKGYENIFFTGTYDKEFEPNLYSKADIINILMPSSVAGASLMSNRFVNAVMYQRPVIVTKGSYQAELVEDYALGVSVSIDDDIYEQVTSYFKTYDSIKFSSGCRRFYELIVREHQLTISKLESLMK